MGDIGRYVIWTKSLEYNPKVAGSAVALYRKIPKHEFVCHHFLRILQTRTLQKLSILRDHPENRRIIEGETA
jgi:hypothetical protein